ncbi:MAG: ROK family protein [Clostridia bacterium]|nr:ROK family protein [Clostridia bacterium]
MKPLKLKAAFKDYIWGGTKLNDQYHKNSGMERTAESWELSTHPDGLSVIDGGEFNGMTLAEFIANDPSVLGTARTSDELPILVKLIDAADNLSIQVHPNNEQGRAWENQNGKTEMWYVMEAEQDAKIVYGVQKDTTGEALAEAIRSNTVMDLLESVPSQKGQVFFVDAGTIHAIGKGNLIAEIQQNSNVTYRLYDYDRRDQNGNPRELHIEKGIKAANPKKLPQRAIPNCSDGTRLLGSCAYFQVKELKVDGKSEQICYPESYQCLMAVEGTLFVNGAPLNVGETLFLPADMGAYTVEGNGTLLKTANPPRYFAGIDLGGTNIAVAIVDEYGVLYGRAKRKTNAPRPYNEVFDDMAACVVDAVRYSGLTMEDIEAVGIGCPGAINKKEGTVEFSNNLGFYDVPIVSYMEKALEKKVYVENDANAAAWGEFLAGSGKGTQNMIMVTLGTGVGSGIIMDGHLLTGAWGKGAELGHMVLALNGEECTCGRKGCFEAYASATALIRQTKAAMKANPESALWKVAGSLENVNGKTAFDADDEAAKGVVDQYLHYLAEGVVNIVNIFQPEVITLGGGISHSGEVILTPLRKEIRERSFARFGKEQTAVTCATLGNDAGIIGAALLWKNE